MASLISGVTVLLTLLVLAPLFSDLPKPVLAALIIEAVVMGMMNVPEMRRLARVQRFDFWIAIAAILGTLLFGVLAGVVIGIGLSLLWLVSVATHPEMPVLGREPGTQVFRELAEHPDDEQVPEVVVLRLDGGLFFATSDALEDRVRELIHSTPGITGMVLDCEGIDYIDSQGSAKLGEIVSLTEQSGITLRLARVKPAVSTTLGKDGILDLIGTDKIHGNVHRAVSAQLDAPAATHREHIAGIAARPMRKDGRHAGVRRCHARRASCAGVERRRRRDLGTQRGPGVLGVRSRRGAGAAS